jgi:hypothetical protein
MDFQALKNLFDAYGPAVGIAAMALALGWLLVKRGFSFSMKMDVGDKR